MQALLSLTKRRCRGFSLVELLVVLAIIMIVSAMAMPNIVNAVRTARLRSAGSELGGFLEQVRMTAVRENKTMYVRNTVVNGVATWYGDRNRNDQLDVGEPQIGLSSTLTIANVAFPAATATMQATNPLGTTYLQLKTTADGAPGVPELGFNSRGLPCQVVAGGACNRMSAGGVPTNMIVYVQNDANRFVAVTMSGNGKLRIWVWDGVAYE